jgi:HK97 family phage prohead protease
MAIDKKKIYKKDFSIHLKSVDKEQFVIRGIFSTADEDRHGEIIDQKGWHLDEFMANPVILFAHDQWTPAVGKAIELQIDNDGNLSGAIQFAVKEDTSGLAETLFNLYAGGFMRAFSVGFENNLYEYNQDTEQPILKENTLYEISCVNVPANGRALAYSKGINLEPLEKLEADIQKKAKEAVEKELNLSDESVEKLSESIAKNLQVEVSRADKPGVASKTKVETPKGRDGKKILYPRKVNAAIRRLLKEKKALKTLN